MSDARIEDGRGCRFHGRRITLMGLGRFGGGAAAARFLADRGARVTVTDLLSADELAESLAQLDGCRLEALHLGGHEEADFTEADLVVVNPAVRPDNRFLALARRAGVTLTSEMSLFWQFQRGRIVGVTGSNGKSTTAALVHSILAAAGLRSRLGGNIGCSLLPVVEEIEPDDWTVLELSSFQLADLDRLPASPDVAVVTNFSPNHLDWHGSLADYRRAKQTILRWQTPEGIAVVNGDDPEVAGWPSYGRRYRSSLNAPDDPQACGVFRTGERIVFRDAGVGNALCGVPPDSGPRPERHRGRSLQESGLAERVPHDDETELALADWLKLPGEHNLQNAMAAACAALAIGVPVSAVKVGLETFTPLPHRLQFVAEIDGRRFYNDSLATTPESVAVAVRAFAEPVVLLAGGYDKQLDLRGLTATIASGTKACALMGQTAELLAALIEDGVDSAAMGQASNLPRRPGRLQTCATMPVRVCRSFEEAFRWTWEQSSPGDVILLSPGCASYDWFRNFAERGERFIELVRGLSIAK